MLTTIKKSIIKIFSGAWILLSVFVPAISLAAADPSSSTLPIVITDQASDITKTSAVLTGYAKGYYDADGLCHSLYADTFEWGKTKIDQKTKPNITGPHIAKCDQFYVFTTTITGLEENSVYHFRLKTEETQNNKKYYGATVSFMTSPDIVVPTSPTLTVSSQSIDTVTLTATGLTVGRSYRINIFDTTGILKNNWDINSVPSATFSTISSPLSPDTYIAKISDGTTHIATSKPFIIGGGNNSDDVIINYFKAGDTTADVNVSSFDPNTELTLTLINLDSNLNESVEKITTDSNGDAAFVLKNLSIGKAGGNGVNYKLIVSSANKIAFAQFKTAPLPVIVPVTPVTPVKPTSPSGLVPCGLRGGGGIINPCSYKDIFTLINTVINFILIYMAVPIAAIMFAYGGFLMLTSGGSSETATRAKHIFTSVAMGLIFIAGSWLIVHTILSILGYDGSWIGL